MPDRRRGVRAVALAAVAAALAAALLSWSLGRLAEGGAGEGRAAEFSGTFRVAAVQMYSRMGDCRGNRERIAELARRAAARGADVIVFPEAAVPGYVSEDFEIWTDPVHRPGEGRSLEGIAEPAGGETARMAASLARTLAVYLAVPFIERDETSGRYFNSVLLARPDGIVAGCYRKINPWPRAEATWASSGEPAPFVADTEFGRLGIMICYDTHSVARRLAEAGATTVLVPTAWVGPAPERWFNERLPGIARQNGMNLVAANWRFPAEQPLCEPGPGCSVVVSAGGEVLAAAANVDEDEIVIADLPILSAAR